MGVGKDLEIPIWPKKFEVRIFCFRLGRLKKLVLKNHLCVKWAVFSEPDTYDVPAGRAKTGWRQKPDLFICLIIMVMIVNADYL